MSAEDYIFGYDFDDEDDSDPWVTFKTCNRCGKGFLTWKKTEAGWRLFECYGRETPKMHTCNPVKDQK